MTRIELHKALARQRLILPLQTEPENLERDELGRLLRPAQLNFIGFQDRAGSKFLGVFTYPDAMKTWRADLRYWIAVDAPSLCVLAIESGYGAMKINPGSPESAELSTEEINALAGRFPVEP